MRRLQLKTGAGLTPVLACLALGCGALPHSQLADCHQRSQALQAETSQLKNETLGLRDRNRELAQRAIEDAHRIHALEQSNSKLEKSILAYQEERNRLVEAFEQLQSQLRTAAVSGPHRTAIEHLETFARAHPGCRFDATRRVLTIPCEVLFSPGSDTLTPGSELVLTALGRILSDLETDLAPGRIVVSCLSPPTVVRVSADASGRPPESALGRRRAGRVRDHLTTVLSGTSSRIDVTEPQESSETTRKVSLIPSSVIEIAIEPHTEATISAEQDSPTDRTPPTERISRPDR